MTIGELCDWYLIEARAGRLLGRCNRPIKASTLESDESRITQQVKPLIGGKPVSWLTTERGAKFQNDIAEGKTAKARPATGRTGRTRGGRGAAARTLRMLSAIYGHARRHGKVRGDNPLRDVRRFADRKCDRYMPFAELVAFGAAMRAAAANGASRTGLAAIRALLITGCRRSEILALPPAWFDRAARCLRFGDTKTGPQIRPLGRAAVEHLAAQPAEGAYLFASDRGEGYFADVRRLLDGLTAEAKIARLTPHALRHTYASIATELGYSELVIKGLLGHAANGVTQRYAHAPDSALLQAADAVAARIAAALDGGAEIIPLPQAA